MASHHGLPCGNPLHGALGVATPNGPADVQQRVMTGTRVPFARERVDAAQTGDAFVQKVGASRHAARGKRHALARLHRDGRARGIFRTHAHHHVVSIHDEVGELGVEQNSRSGLLGPLQQSPLHRRRVDGMHAGRLDTVVGNGRGKFDAKGFQQVVSIATVVHIGPHNLLAIGVTASVGAQAPLHDGVEGEVGIVLYARRLVGADGEVVARANARGGQVGHVAAFQNEHLGALGRGRVGYRAARAATAAHQHVALHVPSLGHAVDRDIACRLLRGNGPAPRKRTGCSQADGACPCEKAPSGHPGRCDCSDRLPHDLPPCFMRLRKQRDHRKGVRNARCP